MKDYPVERMIEVPKIRKSMQGLIHVKRIIIIRHLEN